MKIVVSSKGQVTLPAEFLARDRIRPGQSFDIQRLAAGRYILTKSTVPLQGGVVDWLLACPARGWFAPVLSESTESL